MSEFTYACPHCGQHIRCEAAQGGTTMECPTCFQKIMAPQCPTNRTTKFILTGIKIPKRPRPIGGAGVAAPVPSAAAKKFPLAAIVAAGLIVVVAGAAIVFRGKIFPPARAPVVPQKSELPSPPVPPVAPVVVAPEVVPPVSDQNWKLDLAGVVLPDAPAAGRVNGKDFTSQRATLLGGLLTLRQGNKWPPDLGVVIGLHAVRSADLAGKTVNITTNQPTPPKLTLRWRDEQQQPVTRTYTDGYALRIEFGQLADGRMPGKIYLCLPDEPKSYVSGSFSAEILKPKAPAKAPVKAPVKTPKRKT